MKNKIFALSTFFFLLSHFLSGQTYKEIAAIGDSLTRTRGAAVAEPFQIQRADLAKKEFGEKSPTYFLALCAKCHNQIQLSKLDGLQSDYAILETILIDRNIDNDSLKVDYYKVRVNHSVKENNTPEAKIWADKAVDISSKLYGPKSLKTIGALNNKCYIMVHNFEYAAARPILETCKKLLEETKQTGHRYYSMVHYNLATIAEFEGDFKEAIMDYNISLVHSKKLGNMPAVLEIELILLIINNRFATNILEVQKDWFDYLQDNERVFGKESYQFAVAQFHIGDLMMVKGLPNRALPLLEEAAAKMESMHKNDLSEYIRCCQSLGFTHGFLKNPNKSLMWFKRAYTLAMSKYGPNNNASIMGLVGIYQANNALGNQSENDSLVQIVESNFRMSEMNISNKGQILFFLTNAYIIKRDFEKAKMMLDERVQLFADMTENGSMQGKTFAELKFNLFNCLNKPDEKLIALKEWIKALNQEVETQLMGFSERNKIEYLNKINRLHDFYFTHYLEYPADQAQKIEIFDQNIKYKSIVFQSTELLQKLAHTTTDTVLSHLIEQFRQSKERYAQLSTLPKEKLQKYGYDLNAIAGEILFLENELNAKSPVYSSLKLLPHRKFRDIQSALRPHSAAIDIYQFNTRIENSPELSKPNYAVFIVTPEATAPELIFFENGNEINSIFYEQYRSELTHGDLSSTAVYEAFWKRIEPYLTGIKDVYIAPDGIFHKINFSALRDQNNQFLSAQFQFHFVQSLSSLMPVDILENEPENMACLFGNARFDLNLPMDSSNNMASKWRNFAGLTDKEEEGPVQFDPLPGTAQEVKDIGVIMKNHSYAVNQFDDTSATEMNLKLVFRPKVLHIATHGHFLKSPKREKFLFDEFETADNPMLRSMLFFSGANNTLRGQILPETNGDGVFTAFEAANLDLTGTELVVLSACNTGLGVIENGEGIFGLQRAFLQAGAHYVMMSMWEVEDQQTRIFMDEFYKNWLTKKMSIPEAYQKTQIQMQANGASPLNWGAFVLMEN